MEKAKDSLMIVHRNRPAHTVNDELDSGKWPASGAIHANLLAHLMNTLGAAHAPIMP